MDARLLELVLTLNQNVKNTDTPINSTMCNNSLLNSPTLDITNPNHIERDSILIHPLDLRDNDNSTTTTPLITTIATQTTIPPLPTSRISVLQYYRL